LYDDFVSIYRLSPADLPLRFKLKMNCYMKRFGKIPLGISVGGFFYIKEDFLIKHTCTHLRTLLSAGACKCTSDLSTHHVPEIDFANTKKRKFVCGNCGKAFFQKHHLKSHRMIHTREKPFSCQLCGKRFIASSTLRRRLRIHTGEKPFTCDHCQRSFNQRQNLVNHLRIHTGEKPFKCDYCFRKFSNKSNLNSHIKRHSRENIN
ncbi:gastrula zinc finger protein XlCGF49.1-like, partial [Centruroides sculpturatus]|uniref:gastrula zinc finger protein XlCGF49.1-like n=1 Tax=Centruroides sculpturatus TaxID=218467 RepID=UPI000C6E3100